MHTGNNDRNEPAAAPQTRRAFLQRLGIGSLTVTAASIAGAAALGAGASAEGAEIAKEHRRSVKVFRLSSRGTKACRACQLHHRHFIFLTRKVARHHRAHPGCNCPIKPQWIKIRKYKRIFASSAALENGFVDLRKL